MQVTQHPATELLIDHASGALSPGLCVSVSAHLHFCADCREKNEALVSVGGHLVDTAEPVALSMGSLDSVFNQIDNLSDIEPVPMNLAADETELPQLVKNLIPEEGAKWSFLSPALRISRLQCGEDRYELALHKIKPGGKTPAHDHKGLEVTVVLQGSFSDAEGVYQEGDFLVRMPGEVHRPTASESDQCICLSVSEAPIRLVGPVHRLLNPFFSVTPQ